MIDQKAKTKDFLENSPIFKTLTLEQKDVIIYNHSMAQYKKGDIIYKEGEKPYGLICLSEGKVKVFKEGIGGREQIIRMAKPNGFVGFRALFSEDIYTSSAVAIEDTISIVIEKKFVIKLIKENSNLAVNFIRFISNELGFANNRMVTLTQKHIRGRLAESLLFLKDTYGYAEDGTTIKVYLSREDIANLSNMTTSNAIRTLSTFASENVIAIDGRKLKILDLKRLEKISEMG